MKARETSRIRAPLATLSLAVLVACGGPGGSNNHNNNLTPPGAESYYPLAEGNTWTYRVTESGISIDKVRRVTGRQTLNGREVWLLESLEGPERLVAFTDYSPAAGVRRYRDEHYSAVSGKLLEVNEYDPFTLRKPPLDMEDDTAETYVVRTYDGTGRLDSQREKIHRWTVVSEAEEVTVPAGTFTCIHVRRLNADGSKTREYWYAKGVGKVKETGDFVEELVSYDVEEDAPAP